MDNFRFGGRKCGKTLHVLEHVIHEMRTADFIAGHYQVILHWKDVTCTAGVSGKIVVKDATEITDGRATFLIPDALWDIRTSTIAWHEQIVEAAGMISWMRRYPEMFPLLMEDDEDDT